MTATASEQAARAAFFRPGNIVKLREPFKPSDDAETRRAVGLLVECAAPYRKKAWQEWDGFTHGIVVEVVSTVRIGATGPIVPHTVSLHIYDPVLHLLYMGKNQIPTYVDYCIDELIPWSDSTNLGYVISDWAVEDGT